MQQGQTWICWTATSLYTVAGSWHQGSAPAWFLSGFWDGLICCWHEQGAPTGLHDNYHHKKWKLSWFQVSVRYLQEYAPLGTAGGLHHFRDQIRAGSPDAFIVMNGDVCAEFPLQEMLEFHASKDQAVSSSVHHILVSWLLPSLGCHHSGHRSNQTTISELWLCCGRQEHTHRPSLCREAQQLHQLHHQLWRLCFFITDFPNACGRI